MPEADRSGAQPVGQGPDVAWGMSGARDRGVGWGAS